MAGIVQAQTPDSTETRELVRAQDPRTALFRSAVVPGWGQWKNGDAIKVPFIYAGLATFVGLAVYNQRQSGISNRANLYQQSFENPDRPAFPEFEADYESFAPSTPTSAQLRQLRDQQIRNRNLSILAAAAVYSVNLLDAYVGAQLSGFDVSEDLTAQMEPAGVRFVLRF
ncbi:MAG: DUF5683 domain-containing protein [Bacteroidota bacterium]